MITRTQSSFTPRSHLLQQSMWKYFEFLPVENPLHIASMGEGNTPLIPSSRIGPALGLKTLLFKLEIQNPTGSYKDRFASVAASLMIQEGKHKILATSSGNTGAALAAYAARFGLEMDLYVVAGTPEEKLLQSVAYGAHIYRVAGFGDSQAVSDRVFEVLRTKAAANESMMLVSAVCFCPREMEGIKTIAYEICEQLQDSPDHLFIPVGGGGLLLSCYQGFRQCQDIGKTSTVPRLHAVQPEGCATAAGPLSRHETRAVNVDCASSVSGLQVASLLDAQEVVDKVLLTAGTGQMVSDESIYYWQSRLIQEEGIYTEPAGAAALAGLASALERGQVQPEDVVVCLITGSGFKDLKSVQRMVGNSKMPLIEVDQI